MKKRLAKKIEKMRRKKIHEAHIGTREQFIAEFGKSYL